MGREKIEWRKWKKIIKKREVREGNEREWEAKSLRERKRIRIVKSRGDKGEKKGRFIIYFFGKLWFNY